jgi:hypothetical protein
LFIERGVIFDMDDVFRDLIFGRTGKETLVVLLNDRYSKNVLDKLIVSIPNILYFYRDNKLIS